MLATTETLPALLAWRPFLDPLPMGHAASYLLLIPMALFVSMAYRAVRLPTMREYPKLVLIMTVQIIAAIIAIGVGLYLLVELVLPLIAPMPD